MKETYRAHIQRMQPWIIVSVVALLLLSTGPLLFGSRYLGDTGLDGFIGGFQTGLLLCMAGFQIRQAVIYAGALRSPEKLEALYIESTDERSRFIRDKIGGTGFTLLIAIYGLGAMVAGYFSKTVFFVLLAVLVVAVLVKACLKAYYARRL